jgi:transposase
MHKFQENISFRISLNNINPKLMQEQNNRLDFKGQNIFVGFDAHLKSWQVTIMTEKLTHKTFSQPPDPKVLYQYLVRNFPGGTYHSAYEAGFCGYWIHNQLKSLGINSVVVNPADIPTTNKEKVQKEDSRDSRKIARTLRSGDLVPIHVPSLKTLADRCSVRTRAILVKDTSRNKNRVKSLLHFHGIAIPEAFKQGRWSNRFISWLDSIDMGEPSANDSLQAIVSATQNLRASVLDMTRKIKALSQTDDYLEQVRLLRSIPGIGLITAMTLLTELESMERFKRFDNLCSFIGLMPSTHSSGEHEIVGDITHRGHGVLRSALIESAWIAVRLDPALTKCFYDYCKRMETNKAIIRIAKKLLSRIRYVLINKKPYVCSVVTKIETSIETI